MKKLLSILGTVSLTTTTASSVVACKKTEKTKKENESQKLNDLITVPNLGVIKTNGSLLPNDQQIIDALQKENPQVDITKIKVENISNNSATIISTDETVYTGSVNIQFTVDFSEE